MTMTGISNSVNNLADVQNFRFLNQNFNGVQKERPAKPDVDEMLNKMTEDLNLTDEQKTEIKTILEKDISARESDFEKNMRSGLRMNPNEMQVKMKQGMDSVANQIKSVLNDDQITKFESIINKRKTEDPKVNDDGTVDTYV